MTALIHTIKGNQPIDSLTYSTSWDVNDDFIQLTETYKLDGEVVRESVHVYSKKPHTLGLEQGAL